MHSSNDRTFRPWFVAALLYSLVPLAACSTSQDRPARSGPVGLASGGLEPVLAPSAANSSSRVASAPVAPVVARAPSLPEASPSYYPFGVVHSPMTRAVADQIRQLAENHPDHSADRFSKVGDSITSSSKFLTCLGSVPDAAVGEDLRGPLAAFRASPFDSFRRESSAAENGWSAWQPLAGQPPPLLRELDEVRGLFALVLFGTNDIETSRVTTFARRYTRLVDQALVHGVVPLVSTIPERRDREASRLQVPRFNAAIRAIAQARQVPLVDLQQALSRLPNEGLSSDGIHPSVLSVGGRARGCDFGPEGLSYGFNMRNWVSLQALARARRVLEKNWQPEPEIGRPAKLGERPTLITRLPFVDVGALTSVPAGSPRCSTALPDRGREYSRALGYDLSLTETVPLELLALSSATAESLDFEISRLDAPESCVAVGTGFKRMLLARGDYRVVVRGEAASAMLGLLLGRNGAS